MKQAQKIGILLSKNPYGKYDVDFVVVDEKNQAQVVELVTTDRPLPVALREMRTAIDKLSMRLSRREYVLTSEEPSKLKVDEKK